MKRIITAIALSLTACAATKSPPAPVQPPPPPAMIGGGISEDIKVPRLVVPNNSVHTASPIHIEHEHWALTLPEGWIIDYDDEDGVEAHSDTNVGREPINVAVFTQANVTASPEQYATMASMIVSKSMPTEFGKPENVQQKMTNYGPTATIASLTLVTTDKAFAVGVLAVKQESTNIGYNVWCGADFNNTGAGAVCGAVTRTFEFK